MANFANIKNSDIEKIIYSRISLKLNPIEEKNMWQSLNSSSMTQQNNRHKEVQIILQEMINMINSITEKMKEDERKYKEIRRDIRKEEKTIGDDKR